MLKGTRAREWTINCSDTEIEQEAWMRYALVALAVAQIRKKRTLPRGAALTVKLLVGPCGASEVSTRRNIVDFRKPSATSATNLFSTFHQYLKG